MKKDIIKKKLNRMIKKRFKVKKKNTLLSMNNLENWDSLGHLKLLSEVEQQFKIKFSNKQIPVITDEKKILSLLINKLRLKI